MKRWEEEKGKMKMTDYSQIKRSEKTYILIEER